MHRHLLVTAAVSGAVLAAFLHGCQEQREPTAPELGKAKTDRTLTITGGGNGYGRVTAPPYGEAGDLLCSISGGSADPIYCVKQYGFKTQVVLTATPEGGSSFTGWSGACTGTSLTCKTTMTQVRSVRASFSGTGKPSFVLNVTGGGDGGGRVVSQQGLAPAIDCTVSAGTAVGSGCSATYLEGTVVTLTASPSDGQSFAGWTGDCTGTGTCSLTMSALR